MASQASKFTELLDSDKLQRHTFSDADVQLEDILAAEAAQAAQAAATSRTSTVSRSRSTTSTSSSSSSSSLGSRMKLASQTKLAFRRIAFPSR
ncbi:hypothetical protein EMCG_07145 [[Emmonsia] crescens]|uniref:Uncharacterized protein n=1 Tax=[Emmonsia] crescens TaxID=73230 RepID=A0A0G2J5Z0_9EURO|nr:hypothetical protein EMCG_07145 [Emmonsia crescens UAMH 3008]